MAYSLLTMATQWRYAMSDHGSVARSGPRLRRRLPRPIDWRARFIAALRDGERVERACAAATITPSFAYQQRCADPAFRRAWDQARADSPRPEWQRTFLRVLAEQQSVRHAIAAAGRAPSYVYRVRAEDPEFRARWDEALAGERRRPEWQAVFLSTLAETKHITRARLAAGVASSLVYPESTPALKRGVLVATRRALHRLSRLTPTRNILRYSILALTRQRANCPDDPLRPAAHSRQQVGVPIGSAARGLCSRPGHKGLDGDWTRCRREARFRTRPRLTGVIRIEPPGRTRRPVHGHRKARKIGRKYVPLHRDATIAAVNTLGQPLARDSTA